MATRRIRTSLPRTTNPNPFKRAVKAIRRVVRHPIKSSVHGIKILAKRQLTKKEIEWAKQLGGHGKYGAGRGTNLRTDYHMTSDGNIVVERTFYDLFERTIYQRGTIGENHKRVERSLYTPDGKLIKTTILNRPEQHTDRKLGEKTYNPPGSFRYREKRILR